MNNLENKEVENSVDEQAEAGEKHPVVVEELDLLEQVQKYIRSKSGSSSIEADYNAELIQLRDEIAEARPEDIPPLVEQMTRIQALAAQRGQGEEMPADPLSPYFGHLQLEEDGTRRDVLIGKRTYLAPDNKIRIVDWRNAPVSRMFYCYDEGDDYEEEFGGRYRQGEVTARRSVTVTQGNLIRVASLEGTHVLRKNKWQKLKGHGPVLSGGQGSSIRAGGLSPVRGRLGVDADGTERKDKHLPEISALLDKEQFGLIASPASGLIVVQGSAGSGKTTVGLHRIAYLAFQRSGKFRPYRMLVIVFNEALASYVSGVLPALGVKGVRVLTFAKWAEGLRKKHVLGLPFRYSEWTPSVVTRLKKHPALLSILDDIVDTQDEEQTEKLFNRIADTEDAERVKTAWRILGRMPLEVRRRRLLKWLNGEVRIGRDRGEKLNLATAIAAEGALEKMGEVTNDVVFDWANLFTDRVALQVAFDTHAPCEFTEGELDTVHEWCVKAYKKMDTGANGDDDEPPVLDCEDDAILLRLHQLKKGWLRGPKGRLEYDHLMIDEVQDFSALEVRIMMDTVGRDKPVTLAGDTAQRIIRESGFDNWEGFLNDLGVPGAKIEPLKIAYRSTIEVMEVAKDVLGPLAKDDSVAQRHGAPVEAHQFSDPGQAVDFLGSALRELALKEPMANVAVIARHKAQAKIYYEGLKKSEVPKLEFVTNQDFSFLPGVEVTDIRQVKGLEFDYVILVDVNADSYPVTDEARHLLHVGVTRAAHQLWIVTTSVPSRLIPSRFLS